MGKSVLKIYVLPIIKAQNQDGTFKHILSLVRVACNR